MTRSSETVAAGHSTGMPVAKTPNHAGFLSPGGRMCMLTRASESLVGEEGAVKGAVGGARAPGEGVG